MKWVYFPQYWKQRIYIWLHGCTSTTTEHIIHYSVHNHTLKTVNADLKKFTLIMRWFCFARNMYVYFHYSLPKLNWAILFLAAHKEPYCSRLNIINNNINNIDKLETRHRDFNANVEYNLLFKLLRHIPLEVECSNIRTRIFSNGWQNHAGWGYSASILPVFSVSAPRIRAVGRIYT